MPKKILKIASCFNKSFPPPSNFKKILTENFPVHAKQIEILLSNYRSNKETLLLKVASFLNESTKDDSTLSILNTLVAIPEENQDNLCASAEHLIKRGMNGKSIAAILTELAKIPEDQRESVCNLVLPFIKDGMDELSITALLSGAANIREDEREDVFENSSLAIKQGMSAFAIAAILKTGAASPKEERDSLFKAAAHILVPGMDEKSISAIFEAISKMPTEDRMALCKAASSFVKIGMKTSEKISIFYALQEIPETDKTRFFTYIEKTAKYGNKFIVNTLLSILLENRNSKEYRKAQLFLVQDANFESTVHKILPSILPAKWIAEIEKTHPLELDKIEIITKLLSFLNKSKTSFRNHFSPLMQTFLLATIALDKVEGVTPLRKLELLSCICNQPEVLKGLGLIHSLCARQEIESLRDLSLESPIRELTIALENSLTRDSFINLSDIDHLADKYLECFENTRIPLALEAYIPGIRNLGSLSTQKTLERFIRSILTGTFEMERYSTENNPHLKRIQEYDEQNESNLLEQWKALSFKASVISGTTIPPADTFSFQDFLIQKLDASHGYKDETNQLPELSFFLKAPLEEQGILWDSLSQKIKFLQNSVKSETNLEKKKEFALMLKLNQAQKRCMELLLETDLSKNDLVEKIKQISSQLSSLTLGADLKVLAEQLKPSKKSSFSEEVELCKGWEDLFLGGTEVADSCLRIDGSPTNNKSLLAYCLDGKNSMIAVKDPEGKILARRMLRLLWNRTDSKPILFLDRLYPKLSPKERSSSIEAAAIDCSNKLGLELFTNENIGSFASEKIIESLGSSCPYEYVDGSGGVIPNGVFTIDKSRKINN